MPKTKQMAEEIINKLREVVEAGRRLGSSAILWRGDPKNIGPETPQGLS